MSEKHSNLSVVKNIEALDQQYQEMIKFLELFGGQECFEKYMRDHDERLDERCKEQTNETERLLRLQSRNVDEQLKEMGLQVTDALASFNSYKHMSDRAISMMQYTSLGLFAAMCYLAQALYFVTG